MACDSHAMWGAVPRCGTLAPLALSGLLCPLAAAAAAAPATAVRPAASICLPAAVVAAPTSDHGPLAGDGKADGPCDGGASYPVSIARVSAPPRNRAHDSTGVASRELYSGAAQRIPVAAKRESGRSGTIVVTGKAPGQESLEGARPRSLDIRASSRAKRSWSECFPPNSSDAFQLSRPVVHAHALAPHPGRLSQGPITASGLIWQSATPGPQKRACTEIPTAGMRASAWMPSGSFSSGSSFPRQLQQRLRIASQQHTPTYGGRVDFRSDYPLLGACTLSGQGHDQDSCARLDEPAVVAASAPSPAATPPEIRASSAGTTMAVGGAARVAESDVSATRLVSSHSVNVTGRGDKTDAQCQRKVKERSLAGSTEHCSLNDLKRADVSRGSRLPMAKSSLGGDCGGNVTEPPLPPFATWHVGPELEDHSLGFGRQFDQLPNWRKPLQQLQQLEEFHLSAQEQQQTLGGNWQRQMWQQRMQRKESHEPVKAEKGAGDGPQYHSEHQEKQSQLQQQEQQQQQQGQRQQQQQKQHQQQQKQQQQEHQYQNQQHQHQEQEQQLETRQLQQHEQQQKQQQQEKQQEKQLKLQGELQKGHILQSDLQHEGHLLQQAQESNQSLRHTKMKRMNYDSDGSADFGQAKSGREKQRRAKISEELCHLRSAIKPRVMTLGMMLNVSSLPATSVVEHAVVYIRQLKAELHAIQEEQRSIAALMQSTLIV